MGHQAHAAPGVPVVFGPRRNTVAMFMSKIVLEFPQDYGAIDKVFLRVFACLISARV